MDRRNCRDYGRLLASLQAKFGLSGGESTSPPQRRDQEDSATFGKIVLLFQPLRNVAVIALDGTTYIRINLLTKTSLEDMKTSIKQKVLNLFWLLRLAIEEEKGPAKSSRLTMTMDFDMVEETTPEGYQDMDRVKSWTDEVSRGDNGARSLKLILLPQLACYVPHPDPRGDGHSLSPFDLFARLPQELKADQFRADVLDFRKSILAHRSQLADNGSESLPTAVEIRAFPDEKALWDQSVARMDFSTAETSRDLCFAFYEHNLADFRNVEFLRDDDVSYSQAYHGDLKRRFFTEWPGISRLRYCESAAGSAADF